MVIESEYTNYYSHFYNGYAPVQNNDGKFGVINQNNETIIPFEYINCSNIYGELAWVLFEDESWGYVNKINTIVWRSSTPLNTKSTNKSNQKYQPDNFENYIMFDKQ